jgi:hypothetical protein
VASVHASAAHVAERDWHDVSAYERYPSEEVNPATGHAYGDILSYYPDADSADRGDNVHELVEACESVDHFRAELAAMPDPAAWRAAHPVIDCDPTDPYVAPSQDVDAAAEGA